MAEHTVPPVNNGTDTGASEDMGSEDMDAVADRLEAALERIAQHLDAARVEAATPDAARPAHVPAELVARLDGLIGRLRDVLGGQPGASQD